MSPFGLKPLGPASRDEAYAFCARDPVASTYVAGWIAEGGLDRSPTVPRAWLFADMAGGQISGLVYVSNTGVVVPLPGDTREGGLDGLTELARTHRSSVRVIVGERSVVARLWGRLERLGFATRISRDQLSYAVTRARFDATEANLPLSVATREDVDAVVDASAAMAREETHDDPQGRNPELFRTRILERILRGRDFIYREDGRLVFKSNVASLSTIGGQVEGVYTAPVDRGRHIGLRGAASITAWVLARAERAVLLVNEDNRVARHVYERLGYEQISESRTIFVG